MVKSVSEAQISAWLKRSPQGTAIAVSSLEGMKSLRRFLKKGELTGRADARIGRWTEDARAFNTVFLCPAGECPVRYERVILWDAPKEAFASLPEGELFRPAVRTETGWRHELPSVDRLREMFIAARNLTKGGALLRTSASDIEQELARAAGGGWVEAMASLAALRSMQLIGPERERLYLMPPRKADPLDDITYQKIRLLRDDAKGKG